MELTEKYRQQLFALLPQGAAWTREADSTLYQLLEALATQLAKVDQRARELLRETDPREAIELLDAWEAVLGLPDACHGVDTTIQERRAAVWGKLVTMGGQSQAFFITLAKALGYDVTITEFMRPLRCNQGAAGDAIADSGDVHTWRVNAPAVTERRFRAGSSVAGDALNIWGNSLLECAINRLKPAHTRVLFGYGG